MRGGHVLDLLGDRPAMRRLARALRDRRRVRLPPTHHVLRDGVTFDGEDLQARRRREAEREAVANEAGAVTPPSRRDPGWNDHGSRTVTVQEIPGAF